MKLTWNGTGAAWSSYYGNSSAVLEEDGNRLLVDCGHTVPARLQQMGLSLRDIGAVVLTHLHGDHIYGLEEWGFRNFLQWNSKPHLLIAEDLIGTLWRNVLSGTMAQVCNRSCVLEDYFTVTPLKVGTPHALGPWTVAIHPVRHVPNAPSYGVKVRASGVALGFTGDSLADAASWFFSDTEAVFHDCSFAPYFPTTVHAHYEQLREYPEAFRARMFLVHYDDSLRTQREDPAWQADLASTRMRLTEPFTPYTY